MAYGRRCAMGCATWPDHDDYGSCAVCGEPTERLSEVKPLALEDAISFKRGLDFEAFYELWCAERGQTVDGPVIDDLEAAFRVV